MLYTNHLILPEPYEKCIIIISLFTDDGTKAFRKMKYSGSLNNMGLNAAGPLTCGFF